MAKFQVERLKQLPMRATDTWVGGFVPLPAKGSEGAADSNEPAAVRRMVAMWISIETGQVGVGDRFVDSAGFDVAVDALMHLAADEGYAGYRPGKLVVTDSSLAEHLSSLLAGTGIQVEYREDSSVIEQLMEEMAEQMYETAENPSAPEGYLTGEGVTVERVRAFAEAAVAYYHAAPWQHLGGEDLIEIESPRARWRGLQHAIVVCFADRSGMGFYHSREQYWDRFRTNNSDKSDQAPPSSGHWSILYCDNTKVLDDDIALWKNHKLPLANEQAYPVAMHFQRWSQRTARPDAATLAYFEGLMRALAGTTEEEMDTGRWTKTVTTAEGPMEFTLSLPFFLQPPSYKELFERGLTDRRATEALHARMGRFMETRDFTSADEANEAINKEFIGQEDDPAKYPPRTPLEKAQELCYQAFDSIGRRKVALARQALQLCPDCADAYVILAERSRPRNLDEIHKLYTAGVEAGRRALGEQFFQENTGNFWRILHTRPFMRALLGLANVQYAMDRTDDAIASLRELLRLNPNDNQGVRDVLLPLLLTRRELESAEKLLADYEDDPSAAWQYNRALLTFAREGDSPTSRKQLRAAVARNKHVPDGLLEIDETGDPLDEPDAYRIDSPEEAAIYANEAVTAWQATPGAIDWLRTHGKKSPRLLQRLRQRKKSRKK